MLLRLLETISCTTMQVRIRSNLQRLKLSHAKDSVRVPGPRDRVRGGERNGSSIFQQRTALPIVP